MYEIVFSKKAVKDIELLKQSPSLLRKAKKLVEILRHDPFESPPTFEKLIGDLDRLISRRINIKHRLVYKVEGKIVYIIRMWTHYE